MIVVVVELRFHNSSHNPDCHRLCTRLYAPDHIPRGRPTARRGAASSAIRWPCWTDRSTGCTRCWTNSLLPTTPSPSFLRMCVRACVCVRVRVGLCWAWLTCMCIVYGNDVLWSMYVCPLSHQHACLHAEWRVTVLGHPGETMSPIAVHPHICSHPHIRSPAHSHTYVSTNTHPH